MHRVGRAGRFGIKGIALTLFDNSKDEHFYFDIIKSLKLENCNEKLSNI
jgi:superfamily II DNA/RNA helicase